MKIYYLDVEATLQEPILGSLPGNSKVYTDFLAKKAPTAAKGQQEAEEIFGDASDEKTAEEERENSITIFAKENGDSGRPYLYDYVIKGFFKNACKAMREIPGSESNGFGSFKTKIDNLVFVQPRRILLLPPDDSEMNICERPLRAQTAKGERVALAASEELPAGTKLRFTIKVYIKDLIPMVKEWLDYGADNGLGQWHNSGKGRFTYEILNEYETGEDKPKKAAAKKKAS